MIDRHTQERWTTCFECGATAWIAPGTAACEACESDDMQNVDLRSLATLALKPRPIRAPHKDVEREVGRGRA